MTAPAWPSQLRQELVQAADRRRVRRRRRPLQAAGAVLAVVLSALAIVSGPSPALAEVRVERAGDRVVITLLEAAEDPHRVEAALQAAGFDAAVEAVPTGPSAVGRFVGTADTAELPAELVQVDGSPTAFVAFSLPIGWAGSLRLHVGRPAAPHEPYRAFTDALAPGEPLACLPLVGARAAGAAALVAGRADRVDLRRLDVPSAAPLVAPDVRSGPFADWRVHRADAIAPGRVVVWLVPPGWDALPPTGGTVTCDP
jgi:hypothetical protein